MNLSQLRRFGGCIAAAILLAGVTCVVLSQNQLQAGYTVAAPDAGALVPVGAALFSYTNASGVLVSQAGVGAVRPVTAARVFVDEAGTQTGMAMVNSSAQRTTVNLILRDAGQHCRWRRDHDVRRAWLTGAAASNPTRLHRRAGGPVRLLPERGHSHSEGDRKSVV